MVGYNLLNGYGPNGEALSIEVPWEHEENELRILAATDVEDKFTLRLLGTDSYTRVGDVITVPYPFDEEGLPWRLFIWRVTEVNEKVEFDGARIPVEGIVAKLNELSEKVEEAQLLYRRAVKAPEDMSGHMILPTVAVRAGKVMGFDEHGIPLCGLEYIPETKAFLDKMKQMLDEMRKLFEELLADATAKITDLRDASLGEIGDLRDTAVGDISKLKDDSVDELSTLRDSSLGEIGDLRDTAVGDISKLKDDSVDELSTLRDSSLGEIGDLRDTAVGDISKLKDDSVDELSTLRDASLGEIGDLRDSSKEEIESLRDASKEEIVSLFNATKADIEILLSELKKDAEALKDSTMAELAELASGLIDSSLADFRTRAEGVADEVLQPKVDAAEAAKAGAETAQANAEAAKAGAEAARDTANSYATKAINANTGAWDAYSKTLDVLEATKLLKERCEEIYEEITKYRYVVLTREEYDNLVNTKAIEDDVIYFVKGTQGLGEIREELLAAIDVVRKDLLKHASENSTDKSALESKISAISSALSLLSGRVDALDPDLATEFAEWQGSVESQLAYWGEICQTNASGLTTVSNRVNSVISEVDAKLASVEARLAESLSNIAASQVQAAVNAEATARTEADTVLQESVTRLSETATSHETRIKANEDAIASFESGDSEWQKSLLAASTDVGAKLSTHEDKVASANTLGHVYVGGNGIGISENRLALNIRTSHSGLQFANKAVYVNCAEQTEHPTAGTVAKVATDTAGALVVPDATATSKGCVQIDKLDTDTGVLTHPILVGGKIGTYARVLHAEISGDANVHGWLCTAEDVGAEAGAEVVPTEITFYKRSANAAVDTTIPRYLRILRAEADGTAWTIAYQSTNALAPNSFSENDAMTWRMKNVDGRGAIPAGERILITQTDVPSSIATANVRWGAKQSATAHGVSIISSTIPSDSTTTPATGAYSPAADMTYYKTEDLAALLAALTARVESLELNS